MAAMLSISSEQPNVSIESGDKAIKHFVSSNRVGYFSLHVVLEADT